MVGGGLSRASLLKRRSLGGNLISSFSTTTNGGGTAPSARFPATGGRRCLGSRRQRPARETFRAARRSVPPASGHRGAAGGPALRGVYFSWPPAAGAPGRAPGGHPNR